MRATCCLFFVLICFSLTGCGSRKGALAGQVKFKGKPVPGGTITVIDAAGKMYESNISPKGEYSFAGLALGEARFQVVIGVLPLDSELGTSGGAPSEDKKEATQEEKLTEWANREKFDQLRYATFESSGLKATVERGKRTFDLNLK